VEGDFLNSLRKGRERGLFSISTTTTYGGEGNIHSIVTLSRAGGSHSYIEREKRKKGEKTFIRVKTAFIYEGKGDLPSKNFYTLKRGGVEVFVLWGPSIREERKKEGYFQARGGNQPSEKELIIKRGKSQKKKDKSTQKCLRGGRGGKRGLTFY